MRTLNIFTYLAIAVISVSCCTATKKYQQPTFEEIADEQGESGIITEFASFDTTRIVTSPIDTMPRPTVARSTKKHFSVGDYQDQMRYITIYCDQGIIDSLKLGEFSTIVKVTETDSTGQKIITPNAFYCFIKPEYDFDQVLTFLRGIEMDFMNNTNAKRKKQ